MGWLQRLGEKKNPESGSRNGLEIIQIIYLLMIDLHTILGCWMLAVCFCYTTGAFRWVLTTEKLEENYDHGVPY